MFYYTTSLLCMVSHFNGELLHNKTDISLQVDKLNYVMRPHTVYSSPCQGIYVNGTIPASEEFIPYLKHIMISLDTNTLAA